MSKWYLQFILFFLFGTAALAEDIVLQMSGPGLPKKLPVMIAYERIDNGACRQPCRIDAQNVTLKRGENGYATLLVTLPAEATRLCLNMPAGVSIQSATLFMNNGRKVRSERGGDLASDGTSACSFWKNDAHKAKAWGIIVK